ncbi:MAG: DUF2231 domain-containing protein [Myxococcota bacterium]
MDSRVKLLGHPVHPMLIVIPAGLFLVSFIFDLINLSTENADYARAAYLMISAGILGALAAAVFGVIDWFKIPAGTRAKAIGLYHGLGNVVMLLLFIGSFYVRNADPGAPTRLAFVLSGLGVMVLLVTGWLGGELVDRLGVGVDEGANVNAPSSLSHRSTRG